MPTIKKAFLKKLTSLGVVVVYFIIFATPGYCAPETTESALQPEKAGLISPEDGAAPLVQLAQSTPTTKISNGYRLYKTTSPPVKVVHKESFFSKPGNLVLTGLAAVAIGSSVFIASNYKPAEPTPTMEITLPVENEEVFWMTSIEGSATNTSEGDYVKVSIQAHGSDNWIEQEGYGGITVGGNSWVVRFSQFGAAGPFDTGRSFRFKAIMRDSKENILATDQVENVVRK